MSTTRSANKSLAIVGSESSIAAGILIYKLGGIELSVLATLEDKGIKAYADAVQELKNMNQELYFHTPNHRVTVTDSVLPVDGLLLVVAPAPQVSTMTFTANIVDQLKESGSLFSRNKAIILIKSSEEAKLSEAMYNDLVQIVKSALQHHGIAAESTPVIPTDSQGGNFIEPSPKFPWYTNLTLITALDKIFS